MGLLVPFLLASVARAEPHYGWQIAAPDAAGFAAGAAVGRGHLPGMSIGTMATGIVVGPTVHWAHGRVGPGAVSLVGWTFLPIATGLAGALVDCIATDIENGCATRGDRAGTLAGAVGMVAIDSLVLPAMRVERSVRPSGLVEGYGWQILGVDAAGLALGVYVGVIAMDDTDHTDATLDFATGVGVGMYAVGLVVPPVVHAVHGNWESAGTDLAIRWLGPPIAIVPGMMAWCSATGGTEHCVERGVLAGLAISSLIVSSFDAQVLARTEVEPGTPTASLRPRPVVVPRLSVGRDGASAGLSVLY
jgi:hypothetical protein